MGLSTCMHSSGPPAPFPTLNRPQEPYPPVTSTAASSSFHHLEPTRPVQPSPRPFGLAKEAQVVASQTSSQPWPGYYPTTPRKLAIECLA